jgi:hypothetical protein
MHVLLVNICCQRDHEPKESFTENTFRIELMFKIINQILSEKLLFATIYSAAQASELTYRLL